MGFKLYTAPSVEPVSLAEAKLNCRIATSYATTLSTWIWNEVPTGTKNGSNKTFTLTYTPNSSSLFVFLRGQKLKETADFGYTLSSKTVTIGANVDAPAATDNFESMYATNDETGDTSEDTLVTNLIKAARQWCENYQSRAYINQTWDMVLDGFPDRDWIYLPRPPISSVTSVTYIDYSGTSQTMSTSDYGVDTTGEPGRLYLKYNKSWPTTYAEMNCITIRYICGYGATATYVPQSIKQAILMLVGHWYNNREAVMTGSISKEIELAVSSLLSHEQVYSFGI